MWIPNHYSEVRGATRWSAELADNLSVSLQQGKGLADLILTVEMASGGERRLLTHRNKRLRRAVESFGQ